MDYIPEGWSIAILEINCVDGVAGWKRVYLLNPGTETE